MLITALVPTVPEIRALIARLILHAKRTVSFVIDWSLWRRQHQAVAALCHYKRQKKAQL